LIFAIIGALYVLSIVLDMLHGILLVCLPSKNLINRYGSNSWAMISGPTEGIGKAFCEELIKKNFNIILLARNEEKA
jgi:17beta-estradiol 17-dehydrogenase / very-long-chain 3-oxoacyl-CoA reductase